MSRRKGITEKKLILALNLLTSALVELRDATSAGSIPAIITASAAIEELKQLYIMDRAERKARHESMGNFDVED
jgi:hypothetical protein